MDAMFSREHLFVGVVGSLFLSVRFNGEKALSGLLAGGIVALATCSLDKLINGQTQISQILLPLGSFLLQGLAGESTAQAASRRRRSL